jgi:hypothetical protein
MRRAGKRAPLEPLTGAAAQARCSNDRIETVAEQADLIACRTNAPLPVSTSARRRLLPLIPSPERARATCLSALNTSAAAGWAN